MLITITIDCPGFSPQCAIIAAMEALCLLDDSEYQKKVIDVPAGDIAVVVEIEK